MMMRVLQQLRRGLGQKSPIPNGTSSATPPQRSVSLAQKRWLATIATATILSSGTTFAALLFAPPALAQSIVTVGDSGDEVIRIQQRLATLGYLGPSDVDGEFGELTAEAVIQFQTAEGLETDGVVGPATSAALFGGGSNYDDDTPPSNGGSINLPNPTTGNNGTLTSAQIASLQSDLFALGFYTGDTDGIYSTSTQEAVRLFQQTKRLPATGLPDRATLQAIEAEIRNPNSTNTEVLPPPTLGTSFPVTPTPTYPPNIYSGGGGLTPPGSLPSINAYGYDANFFPYVVVVPDRTGANLAKVQRFSNRAFLAGSRRGPFIHAGAYARREDAEALSRQLRSQGLDSRVVYRPQ